MRSGRPDLSLVVPVLDEAALLSAFIRRLDEWVETRGPAVEAILVDDGSRDGSFDLLRRAYATRPWLSIVRHRRRFGQHQAIVTGLRLSLGRRVLLSDVTDAPLGDVFARLVAGLEGGADLVASRRPCRRGWRGRYARLFNALVVRGLHGVALSDIGSPWKGMTRACARAVIEAGGFPAFLPRMRRLKIVEVPLPAAEEPGVSHYHLGSLLMLAAASALARAVAARPLHACVERMWRQAALG